MLKTDDVLYNFHKDCEEKAGKLYVMTAGKTEEVKELLSEYDNKDGDKPDLEGVVLAKENEELSSELERLREENEELSSQIEAAQEEIVDLVSLTEQLKALDDRIEGASVSDTRIYVSEERGEEEVMIVTVLVNKTIDDAKTETLSEWLRVYLGKDNVVLFQQRINDYIPEEEKAEESSGADESSEAEESSSKRRVTLTPEEWEDDFGAEMILGFRKMAEPAGFQVEVVPLTKERRGSWECPATTGRSSGWRQSAAVSRWRR